MSRKTAGVKIAVIGFTGVGKTTVANIFAELTGGQAIDTSDVIMQDYSVATGIPLDMVRREKVRLRSELYDHAARPKARDPAHWGKLALGPSANVVAGFRDREEFETARPLFDHVVWVHRPGYHPAETDKLDSGYGEDFVFNRDMSEVWADDLRFQCECICSHWEVFG